MGLNPEDRHSVSLNTELSRSSSPNRVSSDHDHADTLPSPTATTSMMPDRALTPPPYPPIGYTSTGYDDESGEPSKSDSWRDNHPWLPRLALPAALLIGVAITAATTYALVAWVQRLQANASVDSDLTKWKTDAREKAYNACYLGCNDCNDPSFAFNACQKTAQVKGCDASLMWNWRDEHKYPDACLAAVGKILMGDALTDLKKSYKNRLAMIILTVLAGIVGGAATFFLFRRFSRSKSAREAAKAGKPARTRTWKPSTWRKEKPAKSTARLDAFNEPEAEMPSSSQSWSRSSSRSSSSSNSRGKGRRGVRFFTAFLALFSHTKPAHAKTSYACTGRDIPWNQLFIMNPVPTTGGTKGPVISGVIHGWLSSCYDKDDCKQDCRETCKTVDGKRTCSQKCSKTCKKKTYTDRTPKSFVDTVIPKVKACGFQMVDTLGGNGVVNQRVGNANIERNLWVKISVNGFNVTSADKTDSSVMCLYGIGGK